MRVERFEQAHQLSEGQLVTDADGSLWQVFRPADDGRVWLYEFGSTELCFELKPDVALAEDAPLPWSTVKVVPDDGLPRLVLPPCPVCGHADWPEGGMHAARNIHLRAHERAGDAPTCQTQRLLFASPPHGPTCTLPANHDGGCVWPETWLDPVTGKTIDVATHGNVTERGVSG